MSTVSQPKLQEYQRKQFIYMQNKAEKILKKILVGVRFYFDNMDPKTCTHLFISYFALIQTVNLRFHSPHNKQRSSPNLRSQYTRYTPNTHATQTCSMQKTHNIYQFLYFVMSSIIAFIAR